MSFFFAEVESSKVDKEEDNAQLLHKLECKACPLNKVKNLSPKIKPHGAKAPLIYILNDFPTETDDENNEFLSGKEGDMVWDLIPEQYRSRVRVNSIVRSKPVRDGIGFTETECCRPSIVKDIIESKPLVVLGLGPAVLNWLVGTNAINDWRGRRAVLSLGGSPFYYYPLLHPTDILKKLEEKKYGTDMYEHINEIDFKNIFSEIDDLRQPTTTPTDTAFDDITCYEGGEEDLTRIIDFFAREQYSKNDIGFDIETNGLRPYTKGSKILSMAFSVLDGDNISFALDHKKAKWTKEQRELLDEIISDFFHNRDNTIWAHNLGFEQEWLAYFYGKKLLRAAKWGDTQAQGYVLDNRYRSEMLKLDTLVLRYFGFFLKDLSDIDVTNLDNTKLSKVLKYNGGDSKFTVMLSREQAKDLNKKGLMRVYEDQLSYTPTLVLTQMAGIDVDQKFVQKVADDLSDKCKQISDKINKQPVVIQFKQTRREEFNPSSPDHLAIMFGDILKVISEKKTKGGRRSFDEDVLKGVEHPLAKQVLELKGLQKVKGTYIDNLDTRNSDIDIYPDGKVHASFSTMFTTTGRANCNGPNLQNQPKRKNKELVRPAFIAPPGHSFIAFDYGQLEARVIAMYSKDPVFVKALWEGLDVHQEWAERIARRYPEALAHDGGVMKNLRDRVKNKWVFPLFFGAGKKTVAGYMGIPVEVAMPLFDSFWKTFSGVHKWQKELGKIYEENGYTLFLNGRRRVGPLMWSEIINSPIQGLGANLVMDAFNRLSVQSEQLDKPWLQPVLQIHDDLSFVVPNEHVDDAVDTIITTMIDFKHYDFVNVPMSVEGSCGSNWYDKEDFGTFSSDKWKQ